MNHPNPLDQFYRTWMAATGCDGKAMATDNSGCAQARSLFSQAMPEGPVTEHWRHV
jgi:hypothetical protein